MKKIISFMRVFEHWQIDEVDRGLDMKKKNFLLDTIYIVIT